MANERLQELMRAYRTRPPEESEKSLWQFARERDPDVFSHHPRGGCFREHVWQIGGLYFCKGCVMTLAGAVAGGILFAATRWLTLITDAQAGLIFLLLLLPTFLAQVFPVPRWFKNAGRFLLGVLMISALFLLFVTDSWLVRGVVVAAYIAVKIPLERKRERENERARSPNGDGES
jgi:hypothetical protein